jgi:hypothetical protein
MKTFIIIVGSSVVGIGAGFFAALFCQALGQMSAEEEARKEYLTPDPWDVFGEPYDKHKDDNLTN